VLPFVSTDAKTDHFVEISRKVAVGAHAVIILDGPGWHGARALVVAHNLSVLAVPPYCPDPNPLKNLWQYLRAISVFDRHEAIIGPCCVA
jgi:transposase